LSAKQSEFQKLADEERQLQMAVNVEQENLAKLLKNDRDVEENIDKVRKVDFIFDKINFQLFSPTKLSISCVNSDNF